MGQPSYDGSGSAAKFGPMTAPISQTTSDDQETLLRDLAKR
jgi:hypothetical protein